MSEDPQDPKYRKPSGDSARGAEPSQPAEPVLPADNLPTPEESVPEVPLSPAGPASGRLPAAEDHLPPESGEVQPRAASEDEPDLSKLSRSSLLQRLTGSLRRTGSLRHAGPEQAGMARGGTRPLSEAELRDVAGRREAAARENLPADAAPSLDAWQGEEASPSTGAPQSVEPPLDPWLRHAVSDDTTILHEVGPEHMTGPMHDSGHLRGTRPLNEEELQEASLTSNEAPSFEAPASFEAPSHEAAAEASHLAEETSRGSTPGSGESIARAPGQPALEPDAVDPRMHIASQEDEPDLPKPSGTGSLLERLTGTLRRTTGELLGTGSLRRTGSLREQAGKEAETQRAAKQHRPVMDESMTELRQSLSSEEADQAKKGRGTGRLIQRITGSLRKVTGSLHKTDKLRGQGAEEAGAALLGAAAAGEFESPAAEAPLPEMPEMGDDMLVDRLGGAEAAAPRESVPDMDMPTGWTESPWFTGASEVQPALEEEAEEPESLFASDSLIDWENGTLPENLWPDADADASAAVYRTPDGEQDLAEPGLSGDEPISLLDSGAIAALGEAEETERQAGGIDWVSEIRQEVAEEEESGETEVEEKPRRKGMTGALRNFISSILRGGEDREKAAGQPDQPESAAADAADMNAGAPEAGAGEAAGAGTLEMQSNEEWLAYIAAVTQGPASPEDEAALDEHLSSMFAEDTGTSEQADEADELDGDAFAARFGMVDEAGAPPVAGDQAAESFNPYSLSPEDEALLWGEPGTLESPEPGPAILPSPEDLWEAPLPAEAEEQKPEPLAPDLREQQEDLDRLTLRAEGRVTSSLFGDTTDDAYAAAYLTGADLVPIDPAKPSQDKLLREALSNKAEAQEASDSIEDLRSIALEDYEETAEASEVEAEAQVYQVPIEQEPAAVTPAEEEALGLNEPIPAPENWWTARSLVEKALIVEAAVVALVLLVALPFYTYLVIHRIQARQAAPVSQMAPISLIRPTPLPAELPYPTGIVLPGGWYFALSKSTFVKGEWHPVSSEWKEDTELSRAVALPWNTQTEAVIRTFQPGDRVKVDLSNNKSLSYKIEAVKRVPVTDSSVLKENTSSLVIILYGEKAEERWVVFCKP